MKVIYKYKVPGSNTKFTLTLPVGAEVLTVQKQGLDINMWVLQIAGPAKLEERNFRVIGTGYPFDENLKYVGTVPELGGALIWHYFEVL